MADFAEEFAERIQIQLREWFTEATQREMQLAGKTFVSIVESYRDLAKNRSTLADLNEQIAARMRKAVVDAYLTNVAAGAVPSYRKDDRYADGKLLTALQSDTMAIGTADGIEFIDDDLLDASARQWKRLQYGAGGNPGGLPQRTYRVRFGKNQGFSIGLDGAVRRGFTIPSGGRHGGGRRLKGYFNDLGQFYMKNPDGGKWPKEGIQVITQRPTRGIGARRFLDAGLQALQDNFNAVYKKHFEDAARQAKRRRKRK